MIVINESTFGRRITHLFSESVFYWCRFSTVNLMWFRINFDIFFCCCIIITFISSKSWFTKCFKLTDDWSFFLQVNFSSFHTHRFPLILLVSMTSLAIGIALAIFFISLSVTAFDLLQAAITLPGQCVFYATIGAVG